MRANLLLGEKRSAFGKERRDVPRSTRASFPGAPTRASRRETALRMHRVTRPRENSLIRGNGAPAIFLRARRKRKSREARGVDDSSAPPASTLLPKTGRNLGTGGGKGERKLIANATGTKLPNRLSPGGTGPLIGGKTLFLRGGPC